MAQDPCTCWCSSNSGPALRSVDAEPTLWSTCSAGCIGVAGSEPRDDHYDHMTMGMELALAGIIIGLSAVQSVFGVGLLVFGTPTLLLMGLSFEQVLAYLLPCSIMISLLQIISTGGFTLEPIRKRLLMFTAPAVLAGTLFILLTEASVNFRFVVGAMLMVTGAIRLLGPLHQRVRAFVRGHVSPLLGLLGIVHGLSNLGGGILTFIMGSVYEDKGSVRRHIAFGYGMMAVIQLIALLTTTSVHVTVLVVVLPVLAGLTYLTVGRRLFAWTRPAVYQWSLTTLIFSYGLLLMVKV